jgi:catechol 2,3-dioxygenase-like lactoylglutathione lyase family enzyme
MTTKKSSTSERTGDSGRRGVALLAALCAAAMVQGAAAQQASGSGAQSAQGQQPTTGVQPPPTSYHLPHFNVPKVDHPATLVPSSAGVLGLDHTHIITGDIVKCRHFYVDILGFTVAHDITDRPSNPRMDQLLGFKKAHYKHLLLNMPGGPTIGSHVPWIEVWQVTGTPLDKSIYKRPTGNFQGKGYNAYRVTDLAGLLAKLKAEGIKFINTPLLDDAGKPDSIYVVDPDGQLIELNQYRPDQQ